MLKRLWSHLWLDEGRLVVAHAGILEPMIGRATPRVRRFCLYGDTTGSRDGSGLPTRYHWALDYAGSTTVVYGHTPVPDAGWVNNTLCIDTGCCFGGKLTALRWPEREIVTVTAHAAYARSLRPLGHPRRDPGSDPADTRLPAERRRRENRHGTRFSTNSSICVCQTVAALRPLTCGGSSRS